MCHDVGKPLGPEESRGYAVAQHVIAQRARECRGSPRHGEVLRQPRSWPLPTRLRKDEGLSPDHSSQLSLAPRSTPPTRSRGGSRPRTGVYDAGEGVAQDTNRACTTPMLSS
jgi:hypothetical protein